MNLSSHHHRQLHLTEPQLDQLLAASAAKPGRAASLDESVALQHLAGCAQCRQELTGLRDVFGDLRADLSSVAPAALAPRLPHTVSSAKAGPAGGWHLRMAFAGSFAVLVAAAGLSTLLPHPAIPAVSQNASTNSVEHALPGESDEALLDGIDQDLADSVPPTLKPLAVQPGSAAAGTKPAY